MFENLNLQEVCNIIILVSAVIIAVKNIYGFLKKPVDDLHDNVRNKEEKHIEEVIDRKIPSLLKMHSENVKVERAREDEVMANSIKIAVVDALDDKIEELKEISLDQGQSINNIQHSLDLLNKSQLDLLRYNMNRLYYQYRPYKKILDCDKKAFIKLYTDYHDAGGNTWIDSLYNEVMHWEIVEDEIELKVDN